MVENLLPSRFQFHLQRLDPKRRLTSFLASHKTLFTFLWITAFGSVFLWQRTAYIEGGSGAGPIGGKFTIFGKIKPIQPLPRLRPVVFDLKDFGGVGDGVTLNTEAFERAVISISKLERNSGGGQLNVPPGRWLTAPFNLTSHMTLFLAEDSEILGVEVCEMF